MDIHRSFISFTPVVDMTLLDPVLTYFFRIEETDPPQYIGWNSGRIPVRYPEQACRELNATLLQRGVAPNTNCILKMY